MFNATYFTYDGVYSGIYGLKIASFENDTVQDTAVFSPTLNTVKSVRAQRFLHNGIEYSDAPEYTFSILSETAISDFLRREILTWIVGRNSFRRLQIHQIDFENYYYNCVFTDVQLIYVRGSCFGFTVTAKFDSIYAYGNPKVIKVTGNGVEQTVKVRNDSDVIDDYVYPIVKFTLTGQSGDVSVKIVNSSELVQESFEFTELRDSESMTVDNELKIIESNIGGDRLSCFNKKWLKLQRGTNILKITIKGELKIEVPNYVMIGF